jgi:uncharacterized coiled-coil protein SlyX
MIALSTFRVMSVAFAIAFVMVPVVLGASDDKKEPKGEPATTVEEQLKRQEAMLEKLQTMLVEQQAEILRLRGEVEALRGPVVAAPPPAETVKAVEAAEPVPVVAEAAPAQTAPDDALAKQVERLTRTFGNLRISADMRFRYEGFANQGFDGPADQPARHRYRVRARAGLSGRINEHFDWGIRLATGSFNDPVSTNATLTDYFDRKPFGVDRAFVHFNTATDPVNFDVWGGKFDYTWRRTSLTFDNDLQPEGLSERLRFDLGDDAPLRGVTVTAWQLPFRERGAGADAYIYGGQVLTDWTWSDNWSSTISAAFHDYEQANQIPPFTNVAPTLINAGLEGGTTNTVVVNPVTNLPEFRSKFRILNVLTEHTYRGLGARFPVTLVLDYIHNTSAFNSERDGGLAVLQVGRRREEGDLYFEYAYWRVEREAYPSVFMESDVIPTNSENHWIQGSYMLDPKVEFAVKYFFEHRLRTSAPVNRWLNRYQVDLIYSF